MLENINTSPNSRDDGAGTPENYLSRAVAACEAGDARLGLHLYLAAFEQAAEQSDAPSEDAIMGLKQAWRVACSTKERALAEYIFERLEPYLSDDEVQACVEQLQVLAMERLEGIGLSGDDLMEMTEALSGDFMEMVGPMMAAAVHGEDAAMAQAEALAAPSGAAPAGEEASQPSISSPTTASPATAPRRGAHALSGRGPGRHSRVRRFRRYAELPPRAGRHARSSTASCSARRPGRMRAASCWPRWGSWDYRPSACAWRRPSKAYPCSASAPRPPMPRSSLACATALRARASWCWRISICGERRSSMPPTIWRASSWPPCPRGAREAVSLIRPGGGEPRRLRAGLRLVARGHRSVLHGAFVPPHLRRYRLSHR